MPESSLLNDARVHNSCCRATSFRESGCSIKPPSGKDWICLSGTKYQERHNWPGKLADFLFFVEPSPGDRRICVLEMKAGGFRADAVVAQLRSASELAEKVTAIRAKTFRACLVKRSVSTMEIRHLRRARVRYRGKDYSIHLMNCGEAVPV